MYKYYGVTRSEEYLAHYGIKGMKWGVRKALDSKNSDKKLERQYAKASKKLQKLSERADPEVQYQNSKKYNKMLKTGAAITAGGLAGLVGSDIYSRNVLHRPNGYTNIHVYSHNGSEFINGMHAKDYNIANEIGRGLTIASGLTKLAGIGTMATGITGKAISKHRMTSNKYQEKAAKKRDTWRKEMQSAFKGTKYGTPKKKRR